MVSRAELDQSMDLQLVDRKIAMGFGKFINQA